MPTELPDSAKVFRNDIAKRIATALETMAQHIAPTNIEDLANVNLNTSDNNKLLVSFVENNEVVVRAVENTILTVHSKNVSVVFDSSGEGAVSDADIVHIIAVEDMMSDSGIYPAYIPYRTRGGVWRIKTLNRNNLNFTSTGLISSTRTVKIYYLA